MIKPAALLAVFTFAITTVSRLPVGAAGYSPPAKATKASYGPYQGSKDQNGSAPLMWLGDFDPPVLQPIVKMPLPPEIAAPGSGKLPPRVAGQPGGRASMPSSLLGSWDVTSTRTNLDTLPDNWTDIEWHFERNQAVVWQFELGKIMTSPQFDLVTSRPALSKRCNVDHCKLVSSTEKTAAFNYSYEFNSYKVDSLVTLQLSDDNRSFDGTRRITVLERDKHVPCATMQYALHGFRH